MTLPPILDEVPFGYLLARPTGEVLSVNRVLRAWLDPEAVGRDPAHVRDLFDVAGRFYYETHIGPLLRMQGHVEEIAVDLRCERELVPAILSARLVPAEGDQPARLHLALLKATDRRRYEGELLLARRRTEEALELAASYASDMERFAHLASHDLQAPLRRIEQHLARLRHAVGSADTDEIDRCMGVLSRASSRGRDLVDALLRYAKSRSLPLVLAPARLDTLIRDVVGDVCDETQAAITVDLPAIEAACDVSLIRGVFENLIGNALKYHKPGVPPVVRVGARTRAQDREIGIAVSDEGIGFEPDQARTIFEPFKRLVRYEDYRGTGVGLALVHSVVTRHGWSITAEAAPGRGAIFTVWIPPDG